MLSFVVRCLSLSFSLPLSILTCSCRAAPARSRASAPRATRRAPRRRRPSLRRWLIGHGRRHCQRRRCCSQQLLLLLLGCWGPLLLLLRLRQQQQRERESPSLASGQGNCKREEEEQESPCLLGHSLFSFFEDRGNENFVFFCQRSFDGFVEIFCHTTKNSFNSAPPRLVDSRKSLASSRL